MGMVLIVRVAIFYTLQKRQLLPLHVMGSTACMLLRNYSTAQYKYEYQRNTSATPLAHWPDYLVLIYPQLIILWEETTEDATITGGRRFHFQGSFISRSDTLG